jgi:hypothetical protein
MWTDFTVTRRKQSFHRSAKEHPQNQAEQRKHDCFPCLDCQTFGHAHISPSVDYETWKLHQFHWKIKLNNYV